MKDERSEMEIGALPRLAGKNLQPSGRGFVLPAPVQAAGSEVDERLRKRLVGAFEPGVGYALVNAGQLCYTINAQAHIYVLHKHAKAVLDAIGNPPGYEIVPVLTADRSRCAQVMV